ncbi:unnamed protein product [Prorocentrum cordatum]|uniref:Uncharacterized protein n=1 Tax=Prorocentrum cordatum TaxID=2364126 RepID=A0ABN9XZD7_9DINO|nr:unnamed protein product [Polarella glacialis]
MHRGLRPAPLDMAAIPGRHLSTSRGACPAALDKQAGAPSRSLRASVTSAQTSADCDSLASLGGTAKSSPSPPCSEPRSPADRPACAPAATGAAQPAAAALVMPAPLPAWQLVAPQQGVQPRGAGCEPPLPGRRAAVARQPQETSRGGGPDPEAHEAAAAHPAAEPSSPLDAMLLRAKRWRALTRGAGHAAV